MPYDNQIPDKYHYDPDIWRGKNATAIYLSGPMTGIPSFNFPAFASTCGALRALGHEVISPHEVLDNDYDQSWNYYMRHDLIAMLTHCNSIALLPGWYDSRGAKLEFQVAVALGFVVYDVIDNKLVKQ